MVTHLDYTDDMLHQTIEVLTKLSKQWFQNKRLIA
jgi:hypothetical protein